jgi:hypothetical protein
MMMKRTVVTHAATLQNSSQHTKQNTSDRDVPISHQSKEGVHSSLEIIVHYDLIEQTSLEQQKMI